MFHDLDDQIFTFDEDDADFSYSNTFHQTFTQQTANLDSLSCSPLQFEDQLMFLHKRKLRELRCRSEPVFVPNVGPHIDMKSIDINTTPSSWYHHDNTDIMIDTSICYNDNMVTIEDLKNQYNSCTTCGVSWRDDHVSLDCFECGGYSMERPCPQCDGRCHSVWRRDSVMSHAMHKAQWEGECGLSSKEHKTTLFLTSSMTQNSSQPISSKS